LVSVARRCGLVVKTVKMLDSFGRCEWMWMVLESASSRRR
jgi:hypothetical protein